LLEGNIGQEFESRAKKAGSRDGPKEDATGAMGVPLQGIPTRQGPLSPSPSEDCALAIAARSCDPEGKRTVSSDETRTLFSPALSRTVDVNRRLLQQQAAPQLEPQPQRCEPGTEIWERSDRGTI
jgi:hypothetical protein